MNELLKLHKQMYDVRWNGVEGDPEQLEKEFMSMANLEGIDLEKVNEMLEQIFIPPYQEDLLPEHLKLNQHGGKREGAGRKPIGVTKRVALTLPEDLWERIEEQKEKEGISLAAILRDIVEYYHNETTLKLSDTELEMLIRSLTFRASQTSVGSTEEKLLERLKGLLKDGHEVCVHCGEVFEQIQDETYCQNCIREYFED